MIDKNTIPEHWEVKKLSEVCDKISLNRIKIKQKDYLDKGIFPVVDQGQELIGGYYNDEKLVVPNEPPYIIFGDHTRVKKYINFKFIVGADGVKVLKPYSTYDSKFFYYLIQTIRVPNKGYARHFQFLEKEEIPLPPLAEQQEIVAKIEELLSELDKGKEQLETARQQLKVYRQAVLKWAFEGRLTNPEVEEGELPEGWKQVELNDICSIIGGVTKGRDFKGKETITIPYLRVANVQDGYLDLREIKEIVVLPNDKEKYKLAFGDILYTEGGDKDKLGRGTIWKEEIEDCIHQNHIFRARPISTQTNSKFIAYFSQTKTAKNYFLKHGKQTTNLASINLTVLKNLPFSFPPFEIQNKIVQEIESRLSVCDKVEETIIQSLQQAETLRQSILKKAFEGKLVKQKAEVVRPKNLYFYQVQLLAYLIHYSNLKGIHHGEMTAAKYAYLLHKIYGINTYYNYKRWHLGPYAPEMKKVVNNKKFFSWKDTGLSIVNPDSILNYTNPVKEQVEIAIDELSQLFVSLPGKTRAHETELLATVCKVIEDTQSTDLQAVRTSMAEWKIDLTTTHFKSKAEKFSEEEARECLKVLIEKGWDKKLIN